MDFVLPSTSHSDRKPNSSSMPIVSNRANKKNVGDNVTLTPVDIDVLRGLNKDYVIAQQSGLVDQQAHRAWAFRAALFSITFIAVYMTLGIVFFRSQTDWSLPDTILFAVYSATSAGYGHVDIPSTPLFQMVDTCYVLVGIASLAIMVAQVYQFLLLEASRAQDNRRAAELARSAKSDDSSNNRFGDSLWKLIDRTRSFFRETMAGRILSVFLPLAFLALSGACAIGYIEGWTFVECIYFGVISLTTTGYGDYYPTKTSSILLCAVWLPFNIVFTSIYMGSVAKWYLRISSKGIQHIRTKMQDDIVRRQPLNLFSTTPSIEQIEILDVEVGAEPVIHEVSENSDSADTSTIHDDKESSKSSEEDDPTSEKELLAIAADGGTLVVFENLNSTLITMSDVIKAVETSTATDLFQPVIQSEIADSQRAIAFQEAVHCESSKQPCFKLRVLVQQRLAEIIANDLVGGEHLVDVQDTMIVVQIGQWKEVVAKWRIPSGAWKAFRAATLDAIMLAGERNLIRQGPGALFQLSPDEFHSIFSSLVAAMGDAETLQGWLNSTEHLTEEASAEVGSEILRKHPFYGCTSLLEIEILPTVTIIGEAAFAVCRSLTRVRFHEDSVLTIIGEEAFYECSSLIEVNIPSSVESIEDRAFCLCESLTKVSFHDDGLLATIGFAAFCQCSSLTEVSIPSSVEIIGKHAFGTCKSLTKVCFHEDGLLATIGDAAFYQCSSLQEVNFAEANLKTIGAKTFRNCVNLQKINIPSTVGLLESAAFLGCRSLLVVKVQNGLKYLAPLVFCGCKNLQAVALPESVEGIGYAAFEQCWSLLSVELGDRPRTVAIADMAFTECKSLVNICLPLSASSTTITSTGAIGYTSFGGCTMLENQYSRDANIFPALQRRFENFPMHKKCYHASVTTTNELAREIESSMHSKQEGSTHLVDPFGLTPFHVLLSAATCRLDLLQVLLDAYPPHVLGWKDVHGKTAVEYLTQRSFHLDEDSRQMHRMALQGWMVGCISSWNGLEAWKSDMSDKVNAIVAENDVEHRQFLLREATMALSRYEQVESTTLLELSLWKSEMKFAAFASVDDTERTTVKVNDRETHRIRSGASVVVPNVIAFCYEANLT
ncbi:unnamed protein product [Cylindrotheca closterium]|uniref:Potassium channel domain-containing protein n=1 Tax=Cylindrotheca closterium TaxID=2856 RepID=A0AAD2FX06_9STRA|nr:unnamed protein product [Cylindrotheca closterium]